MNDRPREFGKIAGTILAGGLSRRMGGGDKGLLLLGEKPLLLRIIERLSPQVDALALNANGDPARFRSFGLEIFSDDRSDFAGPLAGILAAMIWAKANVPQATHLVTVPSDAPFIPVDLVDRLIDSARDEKKPLSAAFSQGRAHPVVALWPLSLREDLEQALDEGVRKIDLWTARHGVAFAHFDAVPFDPFFNVNTPEDLAKAAEILASN